MKKLRCFTEKAETVHFSACRKTSITHFDTLRGFRKRSRISFSCERELYDGTAPEQKTGNAKNLANSMFARFFMSLGRRILYCQLTCVYTSFVLPDNSYGAVMPFFDSR